MTKRSSAVYRFQWVERVRTHRMNQREYHFNSRNLNSILPSRCAVSWTSDSRRFLPLLRDCIAVIQVVPRILYSSWTIIVQGDFLFTRATSQSPCLHETLALLSASGACLATTETECRGRDNLRNSRSVFLIVYKIRILPFKYLWNCSTICQKILERVWKKAFHG